MFKKINNETGSVLLITLAFVLVFTSLGIASIYHADRQNEVSETLHFSNKAFWLADAGVQRAKQKPPHYTLTGESIGNNTQGTYDLSTSNCPKPVDPNLPACDCGGVPCAYRWQVNSDGFYNNLSRSILAIISKFGAANAITATGSINADCNPDGSSEIRGLCVRDPSMNLYNYFGLNYTNNRNLPNPTIGLESDTTIYSIDHSYTGNNYGGEVYDGITVITSNKTVHNKPGAPITNTSSNPAFLIIDCRCPPNSQSCTPPTTCYKYTGNQEFWGIMWVFGNVDLQGTPNLNGSLFVQNGSLSGQLNGNNVVEYDEDTVNDVLENVGGGLPQIPQIVFWKEI